MIEAERDIKCGIPVPRALRIEEHRPDRPDQNVLRADVAVYKHALRVLCRREQGIEARRQFRMRARRGREVRLEAKRVEEGIRRKARGKVGAIRRRRVDPPDHVADRGGGRGVDDAGAK